MLVGSGRSQEANKNELGATRLRLQLSSANLVEGCDAEKEESRQTGANTKTRALRRHHTEQNSKQTEIVTTFVTSKKKNESWFAERGNGNQTRPCTSSTSRQWGETADSDYYRTSRTLKTHWPECEIRERKLEGTRELQEDNSGC